MTGALVLGSDYRGLGAVQSLGRQGIDVWVVHESRGVADVSRYARRTIRFPTGADDSKVDFLLELGRRHALEGWVLFPTSDKIAAICARNRDVLGAVFRPTTPPWEVYRYAHDKQLTERLAAEIGVPSPRMWELGLAGAADIDCRFPAILKPTVKEERNALTVEKAWRVEDRAELAARYAAALQLLPADQIMLQELIPGDGTNQLSFAALACDGEVICSVVARRTRQIPMDIGRVSTFVETIDDADVRSLGRRVVARLSYTGLVEVEFKRIRARGRRNCSTSMRGSGAGTRWGGARAWISPICCTAWRAVTAPTIARVPPGFDGCGRPAMFRRRRWRSSEGGSGWATT